MKPIVDILVEVTSLEDMKKAIIPALEAQEYPNNRVAYTKGKTEFIVRVTQTAKEYYKHTY